MILNNGFIVCGIFHSVLSEPWSNDSSKFNHRIILNNPYQDQFGNPQTEVIRIDISQEDLPIIQGQSHAIIGKQVICPVVCSARAGGKTGAWLSVRMPKGAKVYPVPNRQPLENPQKVS